MTCSAILSLFHRGTRLEYLRSCREYYQIYLRTPRLPRLSAENVVDNSAPIQLREYIRGKWQVTMVELTVIASMVQSRQPRKTFEIGTFDGRTTLNLFLNLPNSTIHTIDLPDGVPGSPGGNKPGLHIRDKVRDGSIKQLFGNTLEFDFSPWYSSQDFVFVDAGHSYKNALSDSKTALRLVEGCEGAIIWHDYAVMPGVTKAVEEIRPLIESAVDFYWVEDTSLAIMVAKPGEPIKISSELTGTHEGSLSNHEVQSVKSPTSMADSSV